VIDLEVQALSEKKKKDPMGLFEMVCKGVESGYVLESSHPYASENIDQCVEVSQTVNCISAKSAPKRVREESAFVLIIWQVAVDGPWKGICIVFDPRSDTRAGQGIISFLIESPPDRPAQNGDITPIQEVSRL